MLAAYHETKHAVIGLTRSEALEYAEHGIRINAVCPGTIDTPIVSAMLDKGMLAMDDLLRDLPMKRLGRGEEIAAVVLWLCSAGSTFVTGQALAVDGGFAAYNPLLEVRRGAHEVRDVQNIADILVDPEGALERRNHWEKTSHALLVGAILHVLYTGEDKTLRGVVNFLSDQTSPFEVTLNRMMTTSHLGDAPHPIVASALMTATMQLPFRTSLPVCFNAQPVLELVCIKIPLAKSTFALTE